MEFQNRNQKMTDARQKILYFVKIRGPVLPVHVAKELGISMLFASAFLSELVSDKSLKITNMKVGGSPLYFLPGQEPEVERFYTYLPGKEKEAYLMLKENKMLQDDKLEPAIRVALRSLKDFAFPLRLVGEERVFWRFLTFPEQEAMKEIQILKLRETGTKPVQEIRQQIAEIARIPEPQKIEVKQEIMQEIKPVKHEIKEVQQAITPEPVKEKPLVKVKPLIKIKKEKVQPVEFLNEVKEFLIRKDIELLQEVFYDKKEVIAKIRINSDLGKIALLLIAQDKKRVTESDIISVYQKAINDKMPCLFLAREISDKTRKALEQYKNLVKMDVLK